MNPEKFFEDVMNIDVENYYDCNNFNLDDFIKWVENSKHNNSTEICTETEPIITRSGIRLRN